MGLDSYMQIINKKEKLEKPVVTGFPTKNAVSFLSSRQEKICPTKCFYLSRRLKYFWVGYKIILLLQPFPLSQQSPFYDLLQNWSSLWKETFILQSPFKLEVCHNSEHSHIYCSVLGYKQDYIFFSHGIACDESEQLSSAVSKELRVAFLLLIDGRDTLDVRWFVLHLIKPNYLVNIFRWITGILM